MKLYFLCLKKIITFAIFVERQWNDCVRQARLLLIVHDEAVDAGHAEIRSDLSWSVSGVS